MAHDVNKKIPRTIYVHDNDSDEIKSAEFYRDAMYIKIQEQIKKTIDDDKTVTEIYLGTAEIGPGLKQYLEKKGFTIRESIGHINSYYYLQL